MSSTRKDFLLKHKYKILSLFIGVFCTTCLSLCAEEVSINKAKEQRQNLVIEAKKYVGCPYVFGAVGPDSFDCSGLIYYCAREANGTQLPRTAKALYNKAKIIPDKDKEPGDLLFFATTGTGAVSHVGIYIGNSQFISALSDGPNTGVCVSSLKEAYWNPKYIGCGQIYKSAQLTENSDESENNSGSTASSSKNENTRFIDSIILDGTVMCDWAVLNSDSFMINFRGLDFQANARKSDWLIQPGIGTSIRWNYWMSMVQIPLLFTLTFNDYLRVYAGPVFSFSTGVTNDSRKAVSASILPGTMGLSFSTPSITKGDLKVQIVQDISYSVFNNLDNSALNFYQSVSSGLIFFTGVRVSVPASFFQSGK